MKIQIQDFEPVRDLRDISRSGSSCRSAEQAHRNWGFSEIGRASWEDRQGLHPYHPKAHVRYMRKMLTEV